MTSQELSKVVVTKILNDIDEHTGYLMTDFRNEWENLIGEFLLKKFEEGRHVGRDHD